jgi:hypothetical protein
MHLLSRILVNESDNAFTFTGDAFTVTVDTFTVGTPILIPSLMPFLISCLDYFPDAFMMLFMMHFHDAFLSIFAGHIVLLGIKDVTNVIWLIWWSIC